MPVLRTNRISFRQFDCARIAVHAVQPVFVVQVHASNQARFAHVADGLTPTVELNLRGTSGEH